MSPLPLHNVACVSGAPDRSGDTGWRWSASWALQEFEARRGSAARLAGALSFVNVMWGLAILVPPPPPPRRFAPHICPANLVCAYYSRVQLAYLPYRPCCRFFLR